MRTWVSDSWEDCMASIFPPNDYTRFREAAEAGRIPCVVVLKPYVLTFDCSYKVSADSPIMAGSDEQQVRAMIQIMRWTYEHAWKQWKDHHGDS